MTVELQHEKKENRMYTFLLRLGREGVKHPLFKIGACDIDPKDMIKQLRKGKPYDIELVDSYQHASAETAERIVQAMYNSRKAASGSWFQDKDEHNLYHGFTNRNTLALIDADIASIIGTQDDAGDADEG